MTKLPIKSYKTLGFTLVELAIVIIIVGFLIVGISAGASMIRTSTFIAVINVCLG